MEAAVTYYRERFGFNAPHETEDFAVLTRDDAVIHLWAARDDDWHAREDLTDRPICSGAESFLAGTASCRIEVRDVDALLGELKREGVLHEVSKPGVNARVGHCNVETPRSSPRPTWGQGRMLGTDLWEMLSRTMTLLWLLIWFVAGHDALTLSPVNAWAATLILAVGLDLARSGVVPGPGSRRGANR
jgi:hypothetical protein